MKTKRWIVTFSLVTVFFVIVISYGGLSLMPSNDNKVLKFGLGTNGWGPLYPAQQSSLAGAIVISHVFDSLVGVDDTGGFTPSLAKSWDINEDRTIYTFILDTNRMFSNGVPLTAEIYKNSLLNSLKHEAVIANRSALDVLYALKGYDQFESTGDIEGLKAVGKDKLIFHFAKPYRRAIDQLSGTRYGAYIAVGKAYIGTGPYVYERIADDAVELAPNVYYPYPVPIARVEISSDGIRDLHEGKVSIAMGSLMSDRLEQDDVGTAVLSSLLLIHWGVLLNGMEVSPLSEKRLRQAVQYILYTSFVEDEDNYNHKAYFTPNPQFFPPLTPGSLEKPIVDELLNEGKQYVDELKKVSAQRPLVCVVRKRDYAERFNYCQALSQHGVRVIERKADFKETKDVIYHGHDADLIEYGVSYASADPDGIYHYLGKNGAIWSPMSSRVEVEKLLEQGRMVLKGDALHVFYKGVAKTILEEVPMVHFGFQSLFLEYNSKQIEPMHDINARRKAINAVMFKWR